MEAIKAENLSFRYKDYLTGELFTEPVFTNVNFSVEKGKMTHLRGDNGAGKTTLLRLMTQELRPQGEMTGILDTFGLSVMYVPQNCEHALVTDKVWHELVFGLENMGTDRETMRVRSAEIACVLGLEDILDRDTDALSGGQKQLVAIGAALMMRPDVLLLDEPFGMLDPVAADRLAGVLLRLKKKDLTIVLAEHREEYASEIADAEILLTGDERKETLGGHKNPEGAEKPENTENPVNTEKPVNTENPVNTGNTEKTDNAVILSARNLCFAYGKKERDILRELNLDLRKQTISCLVGGNGSGKSTLMKCLSGVLKPYRGKVVVSDITAFPKHSGERPEKGDKYRIGYMPQDVELMFAGDEVKDIVSEGLLSEYGLEGRKNLSPYDLSGGEQQILGILILLKQNPDILLLDEPAKGLCAKEQKRFIRLLKKLRNEGKTIFIVTHDMQFAKEVADECMMMYRGEVVGRKEADAFFADNLYFK